MWSLLAAASASAAGVFETSLSGGGAHALSSYAQGIWGPHDSLHTFCEDSYAVSTLAAEPFNAFGSFCYTTIGLVNLVRLKRLGLPLSWRATCGWWSLVIVGVGSSLFHTTMRYHMELLDEIPMLILVACGSLQASDIHPLGKRWRWRGLALIDVVLVGGLSAVMVVYLVTRIFGLFITGFTVGTVFLLGLHVLGDWGPAYSFLGTRASVRIILARVAWELENHLCQTHPYLWPLHNVWHLGSCLAASDLFLLGYCYRVDKLGVRGIVDDAGPTLGGGGGGGGGGGTPGGGRMTRSRAAKLPEVSLPLLLFMPEGAKAIVKGAKAE